MLARLNRFIADPAPPALENAEFPGKLNHFQVVRAVRPVVLPAHYDVASAGGMAVVAEVAAFVFELDADGLPCAGPKEAPGFAVGEGGLQGLDAEAEARGQNRKKEDDAALVYGCGKHGVQIQRFSAERAAIRIRRMERRRGGRGRMKAEG